MRAAQTAINFSAKFKCSMYGMARRAFIVMDFLVFTYDEKTACHWQAGKKIQTRKKIQAHWSLARYNAVHYKCCTHELQALQGLWWDWAQYPAESNHIAISEWFLRCYWSIKGLLFSGLCSFLSRLFHSHGNNCGHYEQCTHNIRHNWMLVEPQNLKFCNNHSFY